MIYRNLHFHIHKVERMFTAVPICGNVRQHDIIVGMGADGDKAVKVGPYKGISVGNGCLSVANVTLGNGGKIVEELKEIIRSMHLHCFIWENVLCSYEILDQIFEEVKECQPEKFIFEAVDSANLIHILSIIKYWDGLKRVEILNKPFEDANTMSAIATHLCVTMGSNLQIKILEMSNEFREAIQTDRFGAEALALFGALETKVTLWR